MKIVTFILLAALLTGCGKAEVYETVTDEMVQSVSVEPKEVLFDLAQEPVLPAMESDSGTLYLCGDFDVVVHTCQSGDLSSTVKEVSGFLPEELTVIQTGNGEVERYEFVWTSATDLGQQIGRATILDDGNYHYVLSTLADASRAGEFDETWEALFGSYSLG